MLATPDFSATALASRVVSAGRPFWTRPAEPPAGLNTNPECLHCGACCFSRGEEYVRVAGEDWERLGGDAGRLAHFIGNRAFMRMRDGHCAALEVRAATGEYFCTIYERRPGICRELGRGSAACEAEREMKGRDAEEARRTAAAIQGPP